MTPTSSGPRRWPPRPTSSRSRGSLLTVPLLGDDRRPTAPRGRRSSLWIALCVTDGIDGYLARRQGTTRSGAFLDPLADKVLVLGAMVALVANDTFWWRAGRHHRRPRARASRACAPTGVGEGLAVPASGRGQGEDRRAGGRGRLRAAAAHGRPTTVGGQHGAGGRRRPHGRVAACSTSSPEPRRHRGRARWRPDAQPVRTGRMPACAVRSWRSAPSCCSGRSSTPTRRGWASSSPSSASSTCARRRWATTSAASSTCSREALERADAVIVCGGLGPTQDDITREAIAEVMGVELVRDAEVADVHPRSCSSRAGARWRTTTCARPTCPWAPTVIEQRTGTAPGPDLPGGGQGRLRGARRALRDEGDARAGGAARPGAPAGVAAGDRQPGAAHVGRERVARRRAARSPARVLDEAGNATIAFLASGIEGIKVRLTARGDSEEPPTALLDAEEAEVRAVLGDIVFSGEDLPMEAEVGRLLVAQGLTLAVAESLTGGLVASRRRERPRIERLVPGRGGRLRQPGEVRPARRARGPGRQRERRRGDGRRRAPRPGPTSGSSTTGVAGPAEQEGQPPGTVWLGLAVGDDVDARLVRLPGDRDRVRQMSVISLMDLLRRQLLA